MKRWMLIMFLVSLSGSARAGGDHTLITRVDLVEGAKPLFSEGLNASPYEAWVHNYNSEASREIWLGGFWHPNSHLWLGGYGVDLPGKGKFYMLPWIRYQQRVGPVKLGADLGYYMPLNGGQWKLLSPDCSLVFPISRKVEIGWVATFKKVEGGPCPIRLGPTLRLRSGDFYFKANWGAFSVNGKAPPWLRMQVSTCF